MSVNPLTTGLVSPAVKDDEEVTNNGKAGEENTVREDLEKPSSVVYAKAKSPPVTIKPLSLGADSSDFTVSEKETIPQQKKLASSGDVSSLAGGGGGEQKPEKITKRETTTKPPLVVPLTTAPGATYQIARVENASAELISPSMIADGKQENGRKRIHAFQPPFDVYFLTYWTAMIFFECSFTLLIFPLLPDPFLIKVIIGSAYQGIAMACLALGIWIGTRDTEAREVKAIPNTQRDHQFTFEKGVGVIDRKSGLCRVCQVQVGEKTRHCKRCNKCVGRHDHHCRWLNSCIGEANILSFYTMLGFLLMGLLFTLALEVRIIWRYFLNTREYSNFVVTQFKWSFPIIASLFLLIMVISIISLTGVVQFVYFHYQLYISGMTTAEWLKQKRLNTYKQGLRKDEKDEPRKMEQGIIIPLTKTQS